MFTSDSLDTEIASKSDKVNKYALVVGVNLSTESDFRSPLQDAERDAYEMGLVLQHSCNFTIIGTTLAGEKADTMSVKKALGRLAKKRSHQDFLLFYFSGHAQPMNIKGRRDIYLVTHDFSEAEVEVNANIHLSMRELREVLYEQTDAGIVLLILDCCYAGHIISAGHDPLQIDLRQLVNECLEDLPSNRENHLRVILTATGNTMAIEKNGHGLMTGYLLPALRGEVDEVLDSEGQIHVLALCQYLQQTMEGEQFPQLAGEFGRHCILAHYPRRSAYYRDQARRDVFKDEVGRNILEELFKLHAATQHTQPFDHTLCYQATIADLDSRQVSEFFQQERTQQEEVFTPGISDEEHLQLFGFLQQDYLTYGALLCFGRNPSQWVSGATTRCIEWAGNERGDLLNDSREYRGSLSRQFELGRNFLRKSLRLHRVIDSRGSSEEWEIPARALDEALANALVHREYANRTDSVLIEVFNDRVEISSPGNHPLQFTPELILATHKPYPRNPQIAGAFYLYGYIEKLGTGILRMQNLMEMAGLLPPEVELSSTQSLTVIFHRPAQGKSQQVEHILGKSIGVGQLLGSYRLTRLLEARDKNSIYFGEHVHLGTQVTIKVLHAQLTNEDIEKFRNEIRAIASLIHPHLVRILDFGIEGKVPFLVIDYAPNDSLRQRYRKGKILPLQLIVSYVKQIADALQYLHDNKFIYGKIEPENLLLGATNEVLLADLSLTLIPDSPREEENEEDANSINYMAPEQIVGHATAASDQYALAVVTYEWLCGECPFQGTPQEITAQHLENIPHSIRSYVPGISPDIEGVVMKALAKEPEQRFPNVRSFAEDLERVCSQDAYTRSSPDETSLPSYSQSALTQALPPSKPKVRLSAQVLDGDFLRMQRGRLFRALGVTSHLLSTIILAIWLSPSGILYGVLSGLLSLLIFLLYILVVSRRQMRALAIILAFYWGIVGWAFGAILNLSSIRGLFPPSAITALVFFIMSLLIYLSYIRNKILL